LEIKAKGGRQVLHRLVKRSDVFLTNFRQSVIRGAQVDYETLSRHNPRLIYALATGYGTHGSDSDKRSFDTAIQGRSGFMFSMGDRAMTEPTQTQGAPLDQMGATILTYGILAALFARERTGVGQQVEASILGSAIHLQGFNMSMVSFRGRPVSRHARASSPNPMANYYQGSDGKWLMLAEYQSDRFWHEFCDALGVGELANQASYATDAARREHSREVIDVLDHVFATKTRDEWIATFNEKGCRFTYDIINSVTEAASDPQVLENDYITEYDHPTLGRIKALGFPLSFSETPLGIRLPPPALGQHTEEVLLEVCGYDWEEIGRFQDEGAI
jgi:crotonobetainyl-CoA:carnitine CoA-transferase CaiB-like acyl-CoA transferase